MSVALDYPVDTAVQVMRKQAMRRPPVRTDGALVGIISEGDLAQNRTPESPLTDISYAAPGAAAGGRS